ncbi:MAG: porin [Syntrophobacteraceae bacterium]|nr:porin [Syntrophobacteraceae bacterium]
MKKSRKSLIGWLKFLAGLMALSLLPALAKTAHSQGIGELWSYLPELNSYVQGRYTDPGTGDDHLSLRRFKIMLDGGPLDQLHYHFQFIYKYNNDSSTDSSIFLQDAFIVYPFNSSFSLKAGQFIPPFGLERFQSDWNLDFVDRTDVTNRLAPNGNLEDSFARDQGMQGDWDYGGWKLSTGLFQGGGANDALRDNGPLGVARLSYGGNDPQGPRQLSWRAGLAGSARRDGDLNFSGQLPGLSKKLTGDFSGQDERLNGFVEARWGRLRTQAEYFRAWYEPSSGAEIAAIGAYGQLAYLPVKNVILALRNEWFNPDVHQPTAFPSDEWTVAATYDFPWLPLRIQVDHSWIDGGTGPADAWRVQVQYFLVKGFKLG